MSLKDDYRARAGEARGQADASSLENVREKLLRSANAWEKMAEREERVAAARQARADEKQHDVGGEPGTALT